MDTFISVSRDLTKVDGYADDHAIANSFAVSCSKSSEHVRFVQFKFFEQDLMFCVIMTG
jgi:hypothetical protein